MKKPMQDVVPPERSIRNISINTVSKRSIKRSVPLRKIQEEPIEEEIQEIIHSTPVKPPKQKMNKNKSSKIFIALAILVIGGFAFIMLNVFTRAKVAITRKQETVSLNLSLSASDKTTSTTTTLAYEIIELTSTTQKEVKANGEEDAEVKASGKIIIYNNFSPDPQRLITRTRFQTPEGLIYRIAESVVVPGKTADRPGSLETLVYADEPGEKYNIGVKDFTIPGFKDDSVRYKGFYARSVAPMTGGFVGKVKKVNTADKESAVKEMETAIKADVEKQLLSKVPEEKVVLNGAVIYNFATPGQAESSGSEALIKQDATAYAVALDKKELAKVLESNVLNSWQGLEAEVQDFSQVNFSFNSPDWKPSETGPLNFTLSGEALFKALFDKVLIQNQLAGKNKTELGNIVNESKAIESAKASIMPVWKNVFPENPDKIEVSEAN